MMDIVPPSSRGGESAQPRRGVSRPSKSVVKVDWQLPARLRKPVAQVSEDFKRRDLYASGRERNTGDMHRKATPAVKIGLPPYGSPRKMRVAKVRRAQPKHVAPVATGERDVSFDWGESKSLPEAPAGDLFVAPKQLEKPKRRMLSALSFSLWPFATSRADSKKKLQARQGSRVR